MIPFQFLNVPSKEVLELSGDFRCKGCDEDNLTPFKVRTCDDRLCGPCWQKSACNVGDEENKCLACGAETELLCFRDYNQFVGYNVYNGELIMADSTLKDQISNGTYEIDTKAKALEAFGRHEKHVLSCLRDQINKKRRERRAKQSWRDTSKKTANLKTFRRVTPYDRDSTKVKVVTAREKKFSE